MSRFSDYVTSGAFKLSLGRRQVEAMSLLDQMGYCWMGHSTIVALLEKGLIERTPGDENGQNKIALTDAGKAMIPVLRLAGLYYALPTIDGPPQPDIEIRIKKRAAQGDKA